MKERRDLSAKPYYKCLICSRFRSICGGRPTRDMTLPEWGEYICDVMYVFHLSNAYVAEAAPVSIKTMEKISARNFDQDIMSGTKRRIEQIVLGRVGDFTCYLDHNDSAAADRINQLLQDIETLRKEKNRLEKIIDKYLD